MSNRKKIEKFCKDNNIKIVYLYYEHGGEDILFEGIQSGSWLLECKFLDGTVEGFESSSSGELSVDEDIKAMFKEIKEYIEEYINDIGDKQCKK